MSQYKQFTEQHEALYTYFNAYITSGSKEFYYVTADQIREDLEQKFGLPSDSFIKTGLELLEVNVNATPEYNEAGEIVNFLGICFAKDYLKFRALEVGE